MLVDHLTPGTVLLGLARQICSGRMGHSGCYRVVAVGSVRAVEFFERAPGPGEHGINFLPYRSSAINNMPVGGTEVISGEFTGCVMASYMDDGILRAGHVDTNKDTTQRSTWDSLKAKTGFALKGEYDTTGKIQDEHGPSAIILCIASGSDGAISRVHVTKSRWEYNFRKQKNNDFFVDRDFDTKYTVVRSGAY